ncbi:hypothetical protein [Afifella sp. YEN Y35]|uniref:hypothetical protein n=1 Tax=Afifella sp. YEN Y35 TaxID=3388337 RepID=UPI0039E04471
MAIPVTSVDPKTRVEEIVDAMDWRAMWDSPPFEGSNYVHALVVFESFLRWCIKGHLNSGPQQTTKTQIERAAAETWAASPTASTMFIGKVAMAQWAPAWAKVPYTLWTVAELLPELERLRKLVALLSIIRAYIGVGGTPNTLGGKALKGGLESQATKRAVSAATLARLGVVVKGSGHIGLGITILSGVGLTLYIHMLNNAIQEIEEDIETNRIPAGEITQAEWDAFDLRVRRNQ